MKKNVVELFLQLAKHYGGRNYLHVAVINRSVLMTDALLNLGRSCGKTYELCHEKMTGKMIFCVTDTKRGLCDWSISNQCVSVLQTRYMPSLDLI